MRIPSILTCVLLASATAQAAPRVGVIALGTPPEVARAEVAALGLEVKTIDIAAWPIWAPLAAEREQLAAAVTAARDAFIATRFSEARATVDKAERAAKFRGDPEVARRLAELAVLAALCGDRDGFVRAVAAHPALKLDASRWSPDARSGFERARAERDRAPKAQLQLPSAVVFVDGVRVSGTEIQVPAGRHHVFTLLPGKLPAAEIVEAPGRVGVPSVDDSERLGVMRLIAEAGVAPSAPELEWLAEKLDLDAVLVAEPDSDRLRTAAREIAAACAIRHVPPERARAQKPLSLDVAAGRCVAQVHGRFRAGQTELDLKSAPGAKLVVPPSLLPASDRPYVLEYRLWGETLHHARTSESAAVRVLVESDPIPRWYKKWWLWTLVGVGVATVVVVPSVVLTRTPTTDVRLAGSN
jgi:hypothetical protein